MMGAVRLTRGKIGLRASAEKEIWLFGISDAKPAMFVLELVEGLALLDRDVQIKLLRVRDWVAIEPVHRTIDAAHDARPLRVDGIGMPAPGSHGVSFGVVWEPKPMYFPDDAVAGESLT